MVTETIIAHAANDFPHEACGILLGRGEVVEVAEPTANVAANPTRNFEIDPAALLRAHRDARGQGRSVVGWYHSHPDGSAGPSPTDAARAAEDGKLWLIAAAGTVSAWRTVADGPVHGRFARVDLRAG